MAFKNKEALKQMMQGKKSEPVPDVQPEAKKKNVAPIKKEKTKNPIIKKEGDTIMSMDNNGVEFLQKPVLRVRKSNALNIRITDEVKVNIDYLAKKYSLSQSDLITALVNNAVRQDAETEKVKEKGKV